MQTNNQAVLQLEQITKIFPGVRALDGVNLTILPGEVHALCGENGAGKSTLMKIIAGAQSYTSGKILVDQKEVVFHSTKEAEKHGISMIYQEFNLASELSVAENMYLGRLPRGKTGTVDWKQVYSQSQKVLDSLAQTFSCKTKVKHLSVAQAQMVEIAKCLTIDSRVIIMDEPTAALTNEEIKTLFGIIQELKNRGISIIYISHRMDEIFQIADRITVMRDGRYIATKNTEDTHYDDVVLMMVGKNVTDLYPDRPFTETEIILSCKALNGQGVKNVSFQLRKGEILGIAGLLGSGNIELSKLIYGAMPLKSGEITLHGNKVNCSTPAKSLRAGIALVPDDRKHEGLVLIRSVKENISMASLKKLVKGLFVSRKKESESVNSAIKQLNIRVSSPAQMVGNLSGGNQQKVVFAKILGTSPNICLLDEPTRGVDVGAKAEIYQIMNNLTKEGKSIILISSDLPELIGMSDRVLVMREGEVVKELSRQEASQEIVLTYASGGVSA